MLNLQVTTGLRWLLITLVLFLSFPVKAETYVIVNDSVSVTQLDRRTLSRIYAMQLKSWPHNERIQVFALPVEHPTHQDFSRYTLKIPAHKLERLWSRLTFTGTGTPPHIVEHEQEMLDKVANTPGAIGYVSQLPDNPVGIRVLIGGAQ